MDSRAIVWSSLLALCQGQFFSPSFALAPPPIQLGFPTAFPSQSLFLPAITAPPAPTSKKSNPGTYSPFPLPNDPGASQSLINLLTSPRDMVIQGTKAQKVEALFDQGSFRSYNIEMSTQNQAIINADPTQELRVHCRLTTDYNTPQAQTFSDFAVGCGYKGSVGSLRVCLDEYQRDNKICRKLSLRVDARAFKNNGTDAPLIHGMRSLLFAGMPVDLSMMSERTAFTLMNNLGMISPKAVHAKLFMNGKYLGLYSFVQPVDEEFTEIKFASDFRNGKGALYKELWFNPLHMQDPQEYRESGAKEDESFIREVNAAIERAPLTPEAARQLFDQYFDVQSFVDLTAFNTVIGATDDWRQRHNFYLYVREDMFGKKLVWIPWDYDRLYDEGSETRGALKGKPWWDISGTSNSFVCNQPFKSAQEQAAALGGSPARVAWNTDIFEQFPLDINVPVTCDKLTKLLAQGLGSRVRQRTREIAGQISMTQIRSLWAQWTAQIQTALERDPSGPSIPVMLAHQRQLENHLTRAMQKAVNEANMAEGMGGSSLMSSSSGFASQSLTPFASPLTSFSSSLTSFSPSLSSFSSPSLTSFASPSFTSFASPSLTSFASPSLSPFSSPSLTSFASPSFSSFSSAPLTSFPLTTSFPAFQSQSLLPSFSAPVLQSVSFQPAFQSFSPFG